MPLHKWRWFLVFLLVTFWRMPAFAKRTLPSAKHKSAHSHASRNHAAPKPHVRARPRSPAQLRAITRAPKRSPRHSPASPKVAPVRAVAREADPNSIDALVAHVPLQQSAHRARVVIDPGHGGHDSGAIGARRVKEKDVVLAVSKQVEQILEAKGVDVVMTRNDDTFVSLEDRTAFANRMDADAFISIHANSARNKQARGIETYTLNVASDRYAMRLAAIENKTSEAQVSDLQLILADLSTKANSHESVALAQRVQKKMMSYARPMNAKSRDLGVKASLFYVLLGARMPSILVETSFISNADEAKLLASATYQRKLAQAIAEAVSEHLKLPMRVVNQ